jgi:hypothetical protein
LLLPLEVALVALVLVLCTVYSSTNFVFSSLFCLYKTAIQASSHRFSSGRRGDRDGDGISLFMLRLPSVLQFFSPVSVISDLFAGSQSTVNAEVTGIPTLLIFRSSIPVALGWG